MQEALKKRLVGMAAGALGLAMSSGCASDQDAEAPMPSQEESSGDDDVRSDEVRSDEAQPASPAPGLLRATPGGDEAEDDLDEPEAVSDEASCGAGSCGSEE